MLAVRVGWLGLPLMVGGPVDGAIDEASAAVRWVVGIGLWALWTVGLVAVLVPRPVTLTVLRVLAPTAVPVAVWASLAGDPSPLALGWSTALAVGVFFAGIGEHFVDGASYGDERRFLLRAPVTLLAGPVPIVWALVVCGVAAGPLLWATGRWALGAALTLLGLAVAWFGGRALHGLARRWLVMVPAGLVVHDPLSTLDPFLCRRTAMISVGPAPAGTDVDDDRTLDATRGAAGPVVEVRLAEPVSVVPLRGRASRLAARSVTRVLVAPTRPGHVLAEAGLRHHPVG